MLDPRPEEVHVSDIAHSLSLQCRFAGHCREFYSVGNHCLLASHIVDPSYALDALLHDAAEAYLSDLCAPVKWLLPEYKTLEARVFAAIATRFGISPVTPAEVKHVDMILLATEARDLMAPPPEPWMQLPEPLPTRIEPMSSREAKLQFIERYHELRGLNAAA
ncbi:MAG TPA: hypothetical protein VK524_34300 [Polyangiaceae bacterium]|nr:hypothetical protein [Polyangiaceae bacterium]